MSTTSTGSSSRRSPAAPAPEGVPRSPAEVAAALRSLGVVPSRSLGQSFLTDAFAADAEAALVGTASGEPVLEIGGGLGLLTEALLRRGLGPLTVIEKDGRLARHLLRTFPGAISVIRGDALEAPLPRVEAAVGNLPFSVATPILERLWALRVPRIVALLQREVAERLAASPGSKSYGRLTIVGALYGSVELFRVIPSPAFFPPPAVDGRLVVHTARAGALPIPSLPELERVLHALFSSRRKQLGNLLPRLLASGRSPEAIARDSGWPPDWARRRPETLPPEAFFRLSQVLASETDRRSATQDD